MDKPLVKILKEENDYFCLDVHSGILFKVNKAMSEFLENMDTTILESVYGKDTLNGLITQYSEFKKRGFFDTSDINREIKKKYDFKTVNLLSISLMVSSNCNMQCIYCFNDGGTSPTDSNEVMSSDTAMQSVDFLVNHSSENTLGIDFFGGEPLVNFKLIKEIVEYCKTKYSEKKWLFSLITNGTLVTDEIVFFFKQNKFHVVVSYDGVLQDIQRKSTFTNTKNREIIRENIIKLKNALPREDISIRCILTHISIPYIEEVIAEAKELGVRVLFGPVALSKENALNITADDYEKYYDSITNAFTKNDNSSKVIGVTSIPYIVRQLLIGSQRYYSCGVGCDQVGISSTGVIYPCHRFIGVKGMEIGNIIDGIDLKAYSNYVQRYVDNISECSKCWAKYFCGGGCAHESYTYEASPFIPCSERCQMIKKEIEIGIRLYIRAQQSDTLDDFIKTFGINSKNLKRKENRYGDNFMY